MTKWTVLRRLLESFMEFCGAIHYGDYSKSMIEGILWLGLLSWSLLELCEISLGSCGNIVYLHIFTLGFWGDFYGDSGNI